MTNDAGYTSSLPDVHVTSLSVVRRDPALEAATRELAETVDEVER